MLDGVWRVNVFQHNKIKKMAFYLETGAPALISKYFKKIIVQQLFILVEICVLSF